MRQFTVSLILSAFVLHNVSGQIDTEIDLWNTTDSICHTLERNRIMMREVTERDEFAAKNALLKREITNLEFSNSKCNDKLFLRCGLCVGKGTDPSNPAERDENGYYR